LFFKRVPLRHRGAWRDGPATPYLWVLILPRHDLLPRGE